MLLNDCVRAATSSLPCGSSCTSKSPLATRVEAFKRDLIGRVMRFAIKIPKMMTNKTVKKARPVICILVALLVLTRKVRGKETPMTPRSSSPLPGTQDFIVIYVADVQITVTVEVAQ